MKNDVVSRRILACGIAVAMIFASASLFMFSISPAVANDSSALPMEFSSAGDMSGNIMMDYTSVHVPSQDKTYYECMVWNTKTGESALYFYSYTDKGFKKYEDNVQLPSNPLD